VSQPPDLPLPEEPAELRASTRALVEQDPAKGSALLDAGWWIAGPLWEQWGPALERAGLDRERFLGIVAGHRRELWLWVMGERTWAQTAVPLAGRVRRRLAGPGPVPPALAERNGSFWYAGGMDATTAPPLSGRRAQAARNDQLILDAARAVFTADPGAPIATVAQQAGVGISALYRRYRSKEELLQRLATEALRRYLDEAEAAIAAGGDPWAAFTTFMRRCLDAGAGSLTLRLAGSFTPTEELRQLGRAAHHATQRLLDRSKTAGALRGDVEVGDIALLFEQLQAVQVHDQRRTAELRHRYLGLVLDGLHQRSAAPLPGPAPVWEELTRRYER